MHAGGSETPARGDLMLARQERQARRSARRRAGILGSYVATLVFLVVLNFVLPRAMPGDPVDALIAQSATNFTFGEESRAALEEYYGVDRPLPQQFGHYVSGLARGDLGRSISTNATVGSELGRRLPWTILLIGTSLVLAAVAGLVTGVHAGWRRGRRSDRVLLVSLLAVREFPAFLLASLLLFVVSVKLGWLPLSGAQTPFSGSFTLVEKTIDVGRHLLLPALVLTVGLTAGNYLVMRAGMVRELGADHLLLGRAKGLRDRTLKYRYAARNALLPVVSLTALQIGFVVTGDVLIERVFAYPGLGGLIFDSIAARDYPTIQGAFLVVSVSVVTINALADVLYRRLDPRTSP
ncbi:MAG: ABC transporter permease [Acidimicrobiia bacterium]|nr:ABC transporter permease [Acidimicrobiia bacterium]